MSTSGGVLLQLASQWLTVGSGEVSLYLQREIGLSTFLAAVQTYCLKVKCVHHQMWIGSEIFNLFQHCTFRRWRLVQLVLSVTKTQHVLLQSQHFIHRAVTGAKGIGLLLLCWAHRSCIKKVVLVHFCCSVYCCVHVLMCSVDAPDC